MASQGKHKTLAEKISALEDRLEPTEQKELENYINARVKDILNHRASRIKSTRCKLTQGQMKKIYEWAGKNWPRIEVDGFAITDRVMIDHGGVQFAMPLTEAGMNFWGYSFFSLLFTMIHNRLLAEFQHHAKNGTLPEDHEIEFLEYAGSRCMSHMCKLWQGDAPDPRNPKLNRSDKTDLKDHLKAYVQIENRVTGGKDGHMVSFKETMNGIEGLLEEVFDTGVDSTSSADELLGDIRDAKKEAKNVRKRMRADERVTQSKKATEKALKNHRDKNS